MVYFPYIPVVPCDHAYKYVFCEGLHFSSFVIYGFVCMMSTLGEYYSFGKLFRDLQKHVNVGLNLYQRRRTDTDSKFRDLFETLDAILQPLETHQKAIGNRAAE